MASKIVKRERFYRKFTDAMARKLSRIKLDVGGHEPDEKERCIMEALALVTGQSHNDHPICVSPFVAGLCRETNDTIESKKLGRLKRLVKVVLGTAPIERIEYENGSIVERQVPQTQYPEFRQAEIRRREVWQEQISKYGFDDAEHFLISGEIKDIVKAIEEVANVKHFHEGEAVNG